MKKNVIFATVVLSTLLFFSFTSGNTDKTVNFSSLNKDKVEIVENIDFKGRKTTTTDDLQGTKNTIIISNVGTFPGVINRPSETIASTK